MMNAPWLFKEDKEEKEEEEEEGKESWLQKK